MTEDTAMFEELSGIQNLPTLPVVLERLRKAMRDTNTDAAKIEKILQDDPAITARILKIVNSAFYGAFEPINSLKMAIARIGIVAINNISLSTSVFSAFPDCKGSALDRPGFWEHCISTGIAANVLYDYCRKNMKGRYGSDLLHVGGLLHDIGKIIFEQFFHEKFAEALRLSMVEQISLISAESKIIGFNHTQAGLWLAKKWNLSEELQQIIRWHHDPESAADEHRELVTLCHTANYICNLQQLGSGGDVAAPDFVLPMWKRMGLEVGDISEIIDQISQESEKSEVLLSLMK